MQGEKNPSHSRHSTGKKKRKKCTGELNPFRQKGIEEGFVWKVLKQGGKGDVCLYKLKKGQKRRR